MTFRNLTKETQLVIKGMKELLCVYVALFIIFKSFLFMILCQYFQHQVPRIILLVSGRVLIRI